MMEIGSINKTPAGAGKGESMKSWAKRLRDAKTNEDKVKIVEQHIKALESWDGMLREDELNILPEERRQELKKRYEDIKDKQIKEVEAEKKRREEERKAAPYGRCAFTGEPLKAPVGKITIEQAEEMGYAACELRYGRWPNGMEVERYLNN